MSRELEILKILESLNIKIHSVHGSNAMCFCPLHEDRRPSLSVNIENGLVNDFAGCVKGRIHNLIVKVKGCSYAEAEEMVGEPRVDLLQLLDESRKISRDVTKKKLMMREIPESAWDFPPAQEYLRRRGIIRETAEVFFLGYDKKKEAIIFPLFHPDDLSRPFGYFKRCIHYKQFLHESNVDLESVFFGLSQLDLNLVDQCNTINVVEGPFDVMNLWQCGLKNTLGLLGTNLTSGRKKVLSEICSHVRLILDSDDAGLKAADEIARKLLPDFLVSIAFCPDKKDPSDCSKDELAKVLQNAEWYFPRNQYNGLKRIIST